MPDELWRPEAGGGRSFSRQPQARLPADHHQGGQFFMVEQFHYVIDLAVFHLDRTALLA
jgi:hypothetical protein